MQTIKDSVVSDLNDVMTRRSKNKLITFGIFKNFLESIPKKFTTQELELYKKSINAIFNQTLYSKCSVMDTTQRSILSRLILEDYVKAQDGTPFWGVKYLTDRYKLFNMPASVNTGDLKRPSNINSELLVLFRAIGVKQTLELYYTFAYHQHEL